MSLVKLTVDHLGPTRPTPALELWLTPPPQLILEGQCQEGLVQHNLAEQNQKQR